MRFLGLAILGYLIFKYAGYIIRLFSNKNDHNSGNKNQSPPKKGEYIDFEEVK